MDLSNLILDFSKNPRTCDGIDKSTVASACSKLCGEVRYNYPHRHTRIFVNNLKYYKYDFNFFVAMINHEMLHHILDKFSERRNHRNGDVGHWPFAAGLDHLCGWGSVWDKDEIFFRRRYKYRQRLEKERSIWDFWSKEITKLFKWNGF